MSKSQQTEVPVNDCSDADATAAQNFPCLSHSDEQQHQQPRQQKSSATNLQDVASGSSADFVGHHHDDSAEEKLGDNLAVCKRRELDEVFSPVSLNTSEVKAVNEDLKDSADVDSSGENLTMVKEKLEKDNSDECPISSDRKHSNPDLGDDANVNCSNEADHCNSASNSDCSSGKLLGTLEASDVESNFATIDISDSFKTSAPNFERSQVTKSASAVGENGTSTSGKPLQDSWHSLFEIRQRETGYGGRQNGTCAFTHKACGSTHLVQRLVRYTTLNGHSGCVNALHFNESGTLLASGSDDLNIQIWKWMESKSFFSFDSGHRSNVFQCKFMPFTGDCHLVSCARDGQVRLAELSSTGTCRVTKKLAHHKGAAHKLALLCDSSHIFYSCGEDAVSFEVDLRQEKPNKLCVTRENNHKIELYSIHANPFKPYEFVVGGRDYYVRVYDARKINENESGGGVLKKFCPQHLVGTESKANITCAVYNFDGTEILASYNDEEIYLFDNTQPEVKNHHLHQYIGHRNSATVKGVNFYGPKSEFIVSGSDCGNVFLWEKNSEKIVNYFKADEGSVVNVLEPHPHFAFLATSGLDHDVKIWLPLAEEPTQLAGLEEVIKKNRRERENERNEPDIDNRMLWLLMHHLRRSARRQMQHLGEDQGSSSSEDSVDMENDDDDEGEEDGGEADEPMQCNPS